MYVICDILCILYLRAGVYCWILRTLERKGWGKVGREKVGKEKLQRGWDRCGSKGWNRIKVLRPRKAGCKHSCWYSKYCRPIRIWYISIFGQVLVITILSIGKTNNNKELRSCVFVGDLVASGRWRHTDQPRWSGDRKRKLLSRIQ